MAAVADSEPDWALLPPEPPMPLRRLLRRCLEKDRTRRLDSAAAARWEIEDAVSDPAGSVTLGAVAPSRRVALVAIAALAGGTAMAGVMAWFLRPAPVGVCPAAHWAW